jgi:hypothetical protein
LHAQGALNRTATLPIEFNLGLLRDAQNAVPYFVPPVV